MTTRRLVQIISLVALNSSLGPQFKWLCMPVLNCHSCALAWFACPIGVFIHYSGYRVFPYLALGMILVLGATIGRLLCGWGCPFGLLQDGLYRIRTAKVSLPNWTRFIKYGLLIGGVGLMPFFLGESTQASFCRVCPMSGLQVVVPNLISRGLAGVTVMTMVKLALMVGVLILAVLSHRSFCKALCPIGALLAPFNWISFWSVKPHAHSCSDCGRCDKACPMAVAPSKRLSRGIPANRVADCIVCHACTDVCPSRRKSLTARPAQAAAE